MSISSNKVIAQDCVRGLKAMEDEKVDLIFADPPFNIGYEYDKYDDKRACDDYLDWSRQWISEVKRVLKPNGAFWLAIGDDYAAELKVLATRELGFTCRSWVVWYYTFGVHCTSKFTRSHTHLFHFVKNADKFTFNDSAIRVPSARQLVYADKRANPKGRVPDDTWIIKPTPHESWILRPQNLPEGFTADSDTWYFPRVCGTFKERMGFHGCQMPEQLLGRIIRACSNEDELVLDPFVGSGTTLAVAKKLGRNYLGFEISKEYVAQARKRLRNIKIGTPLDGAENPLASVAKTPLRSVKSNGFVELKKSKQPKVSNRKKSDLDDVSRSIVTAFEATHNGLSTDRMLADPELNRQFIEACKVESLPGTPTDWNRKLIGLRKQKALSHLCPMKRTMLPKDELDLAEFGSEAAMSILEDRYNITLDSILCDPKIAKEFDSIAGRFSPGLSPLHYRWEALRIRKYASDHKKFANTLDSKLRKVKFGRAREINFGKSVDEIPAVYALTDGSKDPFYIGATENLKMRMESLPKKIGNFEGIGDLTTQVANWRIKLPANWHEVAPHLEDNNLRFGFQTFKIMSLKPLLNLSRKEPTSAIA